MSAGVIVADLCRAVMPVSWAGMLSAAADSRLSPFNNRDGFVRISDETNAGKRY